MGTWGYRLQENDAALDAIQEFMGTELQYTGYRSWLFTFFERQDTAGFLGLLDFLLEYMEPGCFNASFVHELFMPMFVAEMQAAAAYTCPQSRRDELKQLYTKLTGVDYVELAVS